MFSSAVISDWAGEERNRTTLDNHCERVLAANGIESDLRLAMRIESLDIILTIITAIYSQGRERPMDSLSTSSPSSISFILNQQVKRKKFQGGSRILSFAAIGDQEFACLNH